MLVYQQVFGYNEYTITVHEGYDYNGSTKIT